MPGTAVLLTVLTVDVAKVDKIGALSARDVIFGDGFSILHLGRNMVFGFLSSLLLFVDY